MHNLYMYIQPFKGQHEIEFLYLTFKWCTSPYSFMRFVLTLNYDLLIVCLFKFGVAL